jgi:hypothetical protein
MRLAGNKIFVVLASVLVRVNASGAVELGIDVLESNSYALLKNKRETGVGGTSLFEVLATRGINASAFFKCCGSSSIASQFAKGTGPGGIVANWGEDVARFKGERSQYLLY